MMQAMRSEAEATMYSATGASTTATWVRLL